MNGRLADLVTYQIRVRGRLEESWLDWLDRLSMTFEPETDGLGVTVVTGDLDQAALRGLLSYLWDMNLTVLSVTAPHAGASQAGRDGGNR
jgi:hypothetical protein